MRKIWFTLLFSAITISGIACSICGAGSGNIYMGIYPTYKKSFFSIRHNYEAHNTFLLNDPMQFSHNFYNTTEFMAGSNIGKRLQLIALIPYKSILQNHDDGRFVKSGLGDVSFTANYKVFNTSLASRVPGRLSREIWIGAGIKLATGFSNVDFTDSTTTLADINTQIGSGSTSLLFNIRHSMEISGFGLNSAADIKFGLANSQGYRYGTVLTLSNTAYYRYTIKKTTLTPNVGIIYEKLNGNRLDGSKIILTDGLDSGSYDTGGYSLGLMAGFQANYKGFTIGGNIETPIKQEFAKGQTKLLVKGMVYVTIAL